MKHDALGIVYSDAEELFYILHKQPDLDISKISVESATQYNSAIDLFHADLDKLINYSPVLCVNEEELSDFDNQYQARWHMPNEYKELDIAQWLLDKCQSETELQRIGEELLLFHERNLFDLLRYLKYFVDTMREHNVVWGLGRGSSVASYALYLIGVHKINSLYYDLDIKEFLK